MENRFSALRYLYWAHREFHGSYPCETTRSIYRLFNLEMLQAACQKLNDAWQDKRDDERYYADFA